ALQQLLVHLVRHQDHGEQAALPCGALLGPGQRGQRQRPAGQLVVGDAPADLVVHGEQGLDHQRVLPDEPSVPSSPPIAWRRRVTSVSRLASMVRISFADRSSRWPRARACCRTWVTAWSTFSICCSTTPRPSPGDSMAVCQATLSRSTASSWVSVATRSEKRASTSDRSE